MSHQFRGRARPLAPTVVTKIQAEAAAGVALSEIAARLNAAGTPLPTRSVTPEGAARPLCEVAVPQSPGAAGRWTAEAVAAALKQLEGAAS